MRRFQAADIPLTFEFELLRFGYHSQLEHARQNVQQLGMRQLQLLKRRHDVHMRLVVSHQCRLWLRNPAFVLLAVWRVAILVVALAAYSGIGRRLIGLVLANLAAPVLRVVVLVHHRVPLVRARSVSVLFESEKLVEYNLN